MGGAMSERRMARQAEEGPLEEGSSSTAVEAVIGEEAKKKEVVGRVSRAEVLRVLAYTAAAFPTALPAAISNLLPAHLQGMVAGALATAERLVRVSVEEFLVEQVQRVRREVEEMGYAEIEEGEEEVGGEMVALRRGRRRYWPGVKKEAGGRIRRVN
ncbi:unnamed protein product [Urochloa humidicola]